MDMLFHCDAPRYVSFRCSLCGLAHFYCVGCRWNEPDMMVCPDTWDGRSYLCNGCALSLFQTHEYNKG